MIKKISKKAVFVSFFVFLSIIAINRVSAEDTKRVIIPAADTYVAKGRPLSQYGTKETLTASSYSDNDRKMLLRFDIGDIDTSSISKITLELTASLDRQIEKQVRNIVTDWSEKEVTFETIPTLGERIGYIDHLSQRTYAGEKVRFELDLSKLSLKNGVINIAIDNTETSNTLEVYSREHPNSDFHPRLIIDTTNQYVTFMSDFTGDGVIDVADYVRVVKTLVVRNAQFDSNRDGFVDSIELIAAMNAASQKGIGTTPIPLPSITPTPTPSPMSTIAPAPTFIPTPTPIPVPTSVPTPTYTPEPHTEGIWISRSEILKLPTTGEAWSRVLSTAQSDWGQAALHDNNSMHDVKTYAGALVAVRLNDSQLRTKVVDGLRSAMNSPLSRSLELSRGLQSYIIAADIIGYRTPEFESWVRSMLNANVSAHPGGSELCNAQGQEFNCDGVGGLMCTALRSANNWGGHARASVAAAALYLKDETILNQVSNAHRAFSGEQVTNHLYCQNTNWHTNSSNRYGVNPANASKDGINLSGVLPEDWRRGGEFSWLPGQTGYMWEGMQGYSVTAAILDRAGKVPFAAGNNAILRAMDMLYGSGSSAQNSPVFSHYPSGDDTWIPWLVNYYTGKNYQANISSPGKGMGFTDWTHN